MVKRSLQASLPGIQQAKKAFALKGWTQENLACWVFHGQDKFPAKRSEFYK